MVALLLYCCAVAAKTAAAEPPSRWDLKTAIRSAENTSLKVQKALALLEESRAKVGIATSALLPALGLVVRPGSLKDNVFLGQSLFNGEPYNLHRLEFQARQNLTFWGPEWRTRALAVHDIQTFELALETARRDVVAQVISLYVHIQRLDQERSILNQHREVLANLEKAASKQRNIGRFSTLDLMDIQTEQALLEPSFTELETELDTSLVEFHSITGGSNADPRTNTSIELTTSLEVLAQQGARASEPTPIENMELRSVQLQQTASDLARGITFSRHLPALYAYASYARQAFSIPDLASTYATSWAIGLELSIPLFSGLSSLAEARLGVAQESILEWDRRATRDTLASRQIRSRRAYQSAVGSLKSRSEAFDLANKAQKEGTRGYRDGRYDFLRYFRLEEHRLRAEQLLSAAKESVVRAALEQCLAYGCGARELNTLWEGL